MKKTNLFQKRKWKFLSIMGLSTLLTLFTACDDSENLDSKNVIDGKYHLLDLTVVNSDNGIPQKPENLSIIKDKMTFYDDGSFMGTSDFDNISIKGDWTKENNKLKLERINGDNLTFEILKVNDQELELEQRFGPQGNFTEGRIYYIFHKNPEEIDISLYFSN